MNGKDIMHLLFTQEICKKVVQTVADILGISEDDVTIEKPHDHSSQVNVPHIYVLISEPEDVNGFRIALFQRLNLGFATCVSWRETRQGIARYRVCQFHVSQEDMDLI